MKLGLAQVNTTVGDFAGNLALILTAYERGVAAGAELVVAPELAITGYPPRDLLLKSGFIEGNLAALTELAQSVGYFLGVTVFLAFREAFPTRLEPVDEAGLRLALETLDVDAELRANDPTEVLESDDVVAMGQPALVSYAQHHFDEALSQAGSEADLDSFDAVYRCILVEIIALSHCVQAPTGRAPRPFA